MVRIKGLPGCMSDFVRYKNLYNMREMNNKGTD